MFRSVAQVSIALTAGIVLVGALAVLALGGTAGQAVIWGAALAVAARVIPILASFMIAYWPRRGFRAPRLGAATMTRTIARELWATIKLFFFFHPLQKLVTGFEPDRVVPGEMPIVLVHGFYSNAGFWHRIKRELAASGWHNLFSLNLEPPFTSIDQYAVQLRAHVDDVCAKCGTESVIVVAHSMGGLVARACARHDPGRIRRVICLGTPHDGTVLASLVPAENTRQMRRGSDWLRGLNTGSSADGSVTNIYSEHDNIIVPQTSASLHGAENIRLAGIGHLDMAFSPALAAALKDVLGRIPAGP